MRVLQGLHGFTKNAKIFLFQLTCMASSQDIPFPNSLSSSLLFCHAHFHPHPLLLTLVTLPFNISVQPCPLLLNLHLVCYTILVTHKAFPKAIEPFHTHAQALPISSDFIQYKPIFRSYTLHFPFPDPFDPPFSLPHQGIS